MAKWQLQEAKNRLSEVVRKAAEEGPQVITLRGEDAVVVMAVSDYARLGAQAERRSGRVLSPIAARRGQA